MIVSASYRTDIPAFYGEWFMRRLRAGTCRTVNPWSGRIHEVPLTPESVDGFVFWTRNLRPFRTRLPEIAARWPFVVQYTVTGYPRALETSVVAPERAIEDIAELAARYGPRVAVWRYDPILESELTPFDWHKENFAALARALRGCVDEVVVSFAHIYRKTRRNLDAAARRHGFVWRDPSATAKRALIETLAPIARANGMTLTLCSQGAYAAAGTRLARCIDAERLAEIAGRPIVAPESGNRPDCRCHRARDIGAYDTCPHGCVYCYAVSSADRARRGRAAHDPEAPFLRPPGNATPDRGSR